MARHKKGHSQSSSKLSKRNVKVSSTSTPKPTPQPIAAIDSDLFWLPQDTDKSAKLQLDLLNQVKRTKRIVARFRKETTWLKEDEIEKQVDRLLNLAFLNLLECEGNIASPLNRVIRVKPQRQ